jgi:hypothetical protein
MIAGAINGMYGKKSGLLMRWRCLNMTNRGTSSAVNGTINATRDTTISAPAQRRGSRDIANAAQDAVSTVIGTAKATTISELSV